MEISDTFSFSWVFLHNGEVKCRCLFLNCCSCFDKLEDLTRHLRDHIHVLPVDLSEINECPVKGCAHYLPSLTELQRHLYMHIFHAQRQHCGLVAVNAKEELSLLQSCGFPASSKLVYDGTVLRCEWEGCALFFDDVVSYADHIQEHINVLCSSDRDQQLLYNCGWNGCKMTFRNKSNLRTHVRHHSGDKATACPFCGSFFANNSKLFNHMVRKVLGNDDSVASSSAVACHFCQKTFESERLLREHMRRHVMNYKCRFCSIMFDCPSALHRHILNVHANLKQFNCELCKRKFVQKADLDRHSIAIHSDGLAHACTECDERFRWRKQLVLHMRKHKEGYQQYTHLCHLCDARYTNGFGLSRHLLKKHKCQVPDGFRRYQYKKCADGYMRLQTKRCLSRSLALELGIKSDDSNYVTVCNL